MLHSVHLPFALLDELCGFDLRANRELPVRAGLALGDDGVGKLTAGHDVALDGEASVLGLGVHHADSAERVVLVVGEKRHGFGDGHAGEVYDHRLRPSEEPHLAAPVGEARHLVLSAVALRGGDFEIFTRRFRLLFHLRLLRLTLNRSSRPRRRRCRVPS